jgi:hydroxymethylpyrimidine/phosphomethylpyrimidine kinase
MIPTALTIAGSDPSGGAGLQADLKVFHQHGVYGMSVVTMLTVQNTTGIQRVQACDTDVVKEQIEAVISDIPPQAVKTGALGTAAVVEVVVGAIQTCGVPLTVDPVMISSSGTTLLSSDAIQILRSELLPAATVVTPNMAEAELLAEMPVRSIEDMKAAAAIIGESAPCSVLVTGGHLVGDPIDILWVDGQITEICHPRRTTDQTHGTGCVLTAAITANLACGQDLHRAVTEAVRFVDQALNEPPQLGQGTGPLNLFSRLN